MNTFIEISSGPFTARVLPIGATLSRFRYHERDLVLGFHTPGDHQKIPIYAGAIVGPVANRISDGHVQIDRVVHKMQRNENNKTALHSGDEGLHARNWQVIGQHTDSVLLKCVLPAGTCGLPGLRVITVEYTVDAAGLQVKITAETDAKTPINIAHHPYWVIGNDLANTKLQIAAQHYLSTDRNGLPLGTVDTVTGTAFDYQKPRVIGEGSSLDQNYCLAFARRISPFFAARLIATDGLTLDIETTEPGLQVYAGSGLPVLPKSATFGTKSHPNAAIALEPQGWPDAPNNNNFPNVFITQGEVYQQITRYRIYQAG